MSPSQWPYLQPEPISDFPEATLPLTGVELVPIVQNGITKKTTATALTSAPSLTAPFLTWDTPTGLTNGKQLLSSGDVTLTTNPTNITISLTARSASLQNLGTDGLMVNSSATILTRSLAQPAAGITISNADGVAGNPTFALANGLAALEALSGAGIVAGTSTDNFSLRSITGTTNQITVTNGSGAAGDPTISISANPVFSGTESLTLPLGTAVQRPVSANAGMFRYSTTLSAPEFYNGSSWVGLGTGSGSVTNVSVVTANGLAGSVSNPTTTPAITLSTTVSGILKGNGTSISAAVSGTDYQPAGNYITALTGDVTAAGPGSVAATLANTAVTPGSYTAANITVDSKGRITAAASGSGGGTVTSVSGTSNRITSTGGATPVIDISASYVGQTSITTLGTIATGTWNGTVVAGQYGGTGVANTGKTITLGGNLTTSGAFATTFTMTAATGVTFPTTGTLATLAGSEALTNKSVNGVTLTTAGSASDFLNAQGNYVAASVSSAFSAITSGTNTTAAMVVGSGATLAATGSGTITATAVPVAGITGLGTGVAIFLATPSSANLATAVTDETGSGSLVFANTPTLVTPNIGVATGTSLDVSGVLESGTNTGTGGQLKMLGSISGDVTLKAAAAAGTGTIFQLPANNGTNTYVLQTNGSGITSWVPASGGGTSYDPHKELFESPGDFTPGTSDVLTLTDTPIPAAAIDLQIAFDGIEQFSNAWTYDAMTGEITFNDPIPLGTQAVECYWGSAVASVPGTVTQVSVVSANGFAGSVADDTTTPAITLETTITGILEGDGTAISAASTTGSGDVVLATSPALITPDLGTPSALVGTNISGTASGLTAGTATVANTVSTANEATDTSCFILFVTASGTQSLQPKNNTNLTFNSNTGALGSTGFVGPLTGNVTGNVSGSSGSATGNSGTATALQNARTIGGVSFDGTANITVATATGGFAVSGGALALGANNLTMTGSLAATGSRVTKGWFTDVESTNTPTVGGVALPTATSTTTFTNKRVTPRVQSVSSSATVTPNADSDDEVIITAQAAGLTLANPSGTPTEGQGMFIRIKDNGTARSITFGSEYRAIGTTLPATTVISKTMYIGMIRNSTDTKWDVLTVAQEA